MSDNDEEVAQSLRWIANQVRVGGDMQLKRFDENGVHDHDITLADWLWLLALELDPDHAFEDAASGAGGGKHGDVDCGHWNCVICTPLRRRA